MAGRFDEVLAARPAPRRLGDVGLRYEPSLLIGETARPPRSWQHFVSVCFAAVFSVGTLSAALGQASTWVLALCVVAASVSIGAVVVFEGRDRRTRRFVLNFGTTSLRLDFSTAFAGMPRTLIIQFDLVRDVARLRQPDGLWALTVDFVTHPESRSVLREVLAANIAAGEDEHLDRLHRILRGAFGLDRIEVAEPAAADPTNSTFETSPPRSR